MDIVDFAERILNIKLLDCQKEMLIRFEKYRNRPILLAFPKDCGRTDLRMLSFVSSCILKGETK